MESQDKERRSFFRVPFRTSVQYKTYDKNTGAGTARNISQSGILFQTEQNPPKISSLVWLNLDMRTLKICQEIESKALIFNNGVLGKVVRVEEDTDSGYAYDVGICFLRKDEQGNPEVQELLKTI